jgi:PTM1-like protein
MYSRTAWGGPVDPYINVMFPPKQVPDGQDPAVSVVIFEWKDEDLIGIREKPDSVQVPPHDDFHIYCE